MLPIAQTFSKNDIFALIPTLPEMGSIQSQHGLRSQNANRMLTLFRKICFDGKNSQSLVPTVKTPETPVKSRVSGVLKGAEKRSKCSKRHPLPTTRNQFAGNRTRVRIPPAAPEKKPVFDLGQKQVSFYFEAIIFPETVKSEDYNSPHCPFTSL